ncbi:hypothetical protein [Sulfitobacter geojensis]|uniref:hypothetical protein n=1 Tax=Sulfitobacter geojensis TaxID=1342299 RepID=UPI0024933460|nr:hypothetical protein [Sulfitobacter geojensis]
MTQIESETKSVGILAYGSLISTPGEEIEKACAYTICDVMTPFHIEFARSSRGRGGAPTLVPVTEGGAHVKGRVFVMKTSETVAADILYRREIDKVGTDRKYTRPEKVDDKKVLVERLTNFAGLDVVLYTQIAPTIDPLTAERLADVAIESVGKAASGRDGISYLIAAKKFGIVTALSQAYEDEILLKTKCVTLSDALVKLAGDIAPK